MLPPNTVENLNIESEIVEEQRIIYKTYNAEEVAQWEPKDFIYTLRTAGGGINPRYGYALVPLDKIEDLFAIFSKKIFVWVQNDEICFEEIFNVITFVSTIPLGLAGGLLCEMCTLDYSNEVLVFLLLFLELCEKDAHYYDLLKKMLVTQSKRGTLPLFMVLFCRIREDFVNLLLPSLPESIQDDLWSLSYRFHDSEEGLSYSFSLRGNSIEADLLKPKRRRIN